MSVPPRSMDEVHHKLSLLHYPRSSAPSQSLLYAGLERYALLDWLFFKLLGDKSPFTSQQQGLLTDGADRDEEAARIQCSPLHSLASPPLPILNLLSSAFSPKRISENVRNMATLCNWQI